MNRFQILRGLIPPTPVLTAEPLVIGPAEFYKAKVGYSDRVGLVFTDPKKMFVGARVHYYKKIMLFVNRAIIKQFVVYGLGVPSGA
jgi:energy-coupling factor transporter ATP-binding protein EcfA2